MNITQPRYSKEEIARRGKEIYQRVVKPIAEPARMGECVAIDIESGDWEIDPDEMTASDRLSARHPDAQIWMQRVGVPLYMRRFGAGRPKVGK